MLYRISKKLVGEEATAPCLANGTVSAEPPGTDAGCIQDSVSIRTARTAQIGPPGLIFSLIVANMTPTLPSSFGPGEIRTTMSAGLY